MYDKTSFGFEKLFVLDVVFGDRKWSAPVIAERFSLNIFLFSISWILFTFQSQLSVEAITTVSSLKSTIEPIPKVVISCVFLTEPTEISSSEYKFIPPSLSFFSF